MTNASDDPRPAAAEARAPHLRKTIDDGRFPFAHRTVAEVWADEQRLSMMRGGRR